MTPKPEAVIKCSTCHLPSPHHKMSCDKGPRRGLTVPVTEPVPDKYTTTTKAHSKAADRAEGPRTANGGRAKATTKAKGAK